jgi:hypothetical protein
MARQLTPLGHVVVGTAKWILIPLVAGLVGYKIIGPLIGGPAQSKPTSAKNNPQLSPQGKKFQSVRENDH